MTGGMLLADQSDPGAEVIDGAGLAACAFYAGGNTPHVWTRAQIDRQTLRYAVPVWVYGAQRGPAGGAAEGQDCAAELHRLGVPAGVAVRVDMETSVDVGYLRAFRTAVNLDGYWFGPYGSASTVFGNPHGGAGYWVADWAGHPFEYPHPSVWATQYEDAAQSGLPWDLSEMTTLRHCWDRRPPNPDPWVQAAALRLTAASRGAADTEQDVRDALSILKAHGG